MSQANISSGAERWLLLVLLALTATVWLYRAPFVASDLAIPPDAVEYALAPLELLETGRYEIILEGRGLPPRYPPWFPVSVILPAYVLFGHEPGNAILPITALAVAGVLLAWTIGSRLSSPFGGVLAGIAVLFVPAYGKWASHVMSDVPATTLMLCGWLLFLHMRSHSPTRLRSYFLAGLLVAVAALWRPVFAAMVLPFLLLTLASFTVFLKRAVVLLLPIAAAAAATFAYNAATFGSISRNGYKLWASVPVDYPSLMFSAANVGMNLWVVYYTAIPLLAAIALGAYLLQHFLKRRTLTEPNDQVGASLVFLVLTNGPILLFYLFYFFPTDRFHLPLATGIAVLAGALVARLLGPQRTPVSLVVVAGMLALGIFGNLTAPEKVPRRRLAAERIRQFTPPNAMVISAIEPVYLERLAARGTARRIVPLSRNVEYASKLLAWKRPDHPQPPLVDSEGRRAPGLIAAGNSEAVAFVATEQLDAIAAAAASGTPVFLDTSWVHPADTTSLGSFQGRFQFAERAPELYELRAR